MNLETAPAALVLAMCSIGALYRLERRVSAVLYTAADLLVKADQEKPKTLSENVKALADWHRPRASALNEDNDIYSSQARLLLAYYCAFNGNPEVFQNAIRDFAIIVFDYHRRISHLNASPSSAKLHHWDPWVKRETSKRLVYGYLILSNLLTLTYGMFPVLSMARDGEVELPDDQRMWDARTESEWHANRVHRRESTLLTLRQCVARLLCKADTDHNMDEATTLSPFSCLSVICAVSIQVWHAVHGLNFSCGSILHEPSHSETMSQIEAALSHCRALITDCKTDSDYTLSEAEHPLLFNCIALLRVSFCRTFTDIGYNSRMVVLEEDHDRMLETLKQYISSADRRDACTSLAVRRAFDGMLIPSRTGTFLVRKTAALTWAVEHALAGWDSVLLVSKWTHVMEKKYQQDTMHDATEHEVETFNTIRQFLNLDEVDDQSASLAAKLTRHWASFYDDTWVWGVTRRIGWILRELASCYEEALSKAIKSQETSVSQ